MLAAAECSVIQVVDYEPVNNHANANGEHHEGENDTSDPNEQQ